MTNERAAELDLVTTTLQLDSWKVGLISTTESVDTRDQNPFAEFQRGLLALLAQLERKIIVARVTSGLAEYKRAYAEGKVGKNKTRHSRSGKDKAIGRPKAIFRRDLGREDARRGCELARDRAQDGRAGFDAAGEGGGKISAAEIVGRTTG